MSERVDYPPRAREAINELMCKKDVTDNRMSEYVGKTSSTPCGTIDCYPLIEGEPVYEQLRRGIAPVSRPTDELVRYTHTLESIIKGYTDAINFKVLHESAAPHWTDVLEG